MESVEKVTSFDLRSATNQIIRSRLRTLRTLELSNHPDLSDHFAKEFLDCCPNLERVEIKNCPLVGDETLFYLSRKSPHLRSLFWSGATAATEAGCRCISTQFPTLEDLNLSGTPFSSSDCRSLLSQHSALASLDLSFCPIDDTAFENLSTPLRFLNLQGCEEITDTTLDRLASIKTLRHLCLAYNTRLTPSGLQHLRALPLQTLRISQCPNLTSS